MIFVLAVVAKNIRNVVYIVSTIESLLLNSWYEFRLLYAGHSCNTAKDAFQPYISCSLNPIYSARHISVFCKHDCTAYRA